VDGKAKKSDYRKFKIRTVEGVDDFKSMQEVVRRRYTRMIAENTPRPDLIIIDGGKGQLSHAVEIMRELGLQDITIIGLAKRLEEVFFPDQSEAILLPKTSSSLKLLQQARDEAHRFAIEFHHRLLRDKRTLQTELTNIKGVGEQTATKLLTTLGSVEGVRNASVIELENVAGKKVAALVKAYFAEQEIDLTGNAGDIIEEINNEQ
jgi:excinuclease ABC subunit C